MNTIKVLTKFGLTEKEATVYIALLRYPSAKPAVLARKLDFSRPSVYDAIHLLQQKGLVYAVAGKSVKMFAAKDPKAIAEMIDRDVANYIATSKMKHEHLEQAMPDLLTLAKDMVSVPRVKYFEGLRGIEEALHDTLSTNDIIRAYADIESITQTIGESFSQYLRERIKKGIHARAIVPDTIEWRKRSQEKQRELRDVRFISPGATYSPEINIFDNRVLMISWKESFAVLIVSKDFAHAQRVIFDELWERLPA